MQKYTLMHPLAKGGFSELDLVRLEDGRNAVLRRLLPLHIFNFKSQIHFRRGITMRASLPEHPGIVKSYEASYGIYPAELIEYVPGNNLKILHNQHSAILRENLYDILRSAADALAFVHSCGLQHLDVKPENFILRTGQELQVKLTDFDLTKDAAERGPCKQRGTPAYMAPEQFKFKCSSQASDVFSFCVMAYQLIGGHLPFVGSTPKSTMKHQASLRIQAKELSELNPRVPDNWNEAIMLGLVKNYEQRIPNMTAWLEKLQQ